MPNTIDVYFKHGEIKQLYERLVNLKRQARQSLPLRMEISLDSTAYASLMILEQFDEAKLETILHTLDGENIDRRSQPMVTYFNGLFDPIELALSTHHPTEPVTEPVLPPN